MAVEKIICDGQCFGCILSEDITISDELGAEEKMTQCILIGFENLIEKKS